MEKNRQDLKDVRELFDELIEELDAKEKFYSQQPSQIKEGDIIVCEVPFFKKPLYLDILEDTRYIDPKEPITVKIINTPPTVSAPFEEFELSAGEYFMLGRAKRRPCLVVSTYIRKKEKYIIAFPLSSFKNLEIKKQLETAYKTLCLAYPFRWIIQTKDLHNNTKMYSMVIMDRPILITQSFVKSTNGTRSYVEDTVLNIIKAWYILSLKVKSQNLGEIYKEISKIQSFIDLLKT